MTEPSSNAAANAPDAAPNQAPAKLPHKPALNRHFRMQWEPAQQCHVLLYPEGMVKLNASAGEILKCCDGTVSVDEIVSTLEAKFETTGLREDIEAMLNHAYKQNWIV